MLKRYHKAVTFQDFDIAEQIMKTTTPKKQKSLGRKVFGFDDAAWDKVKEGIVEEGNFWKFTACKAEPERMKQWLLNTGSRQLVEVSWLLSQSWPSDSLFRRHHSTEFGELDIKHRMQSKTAFFGGKTYWARR